MGRRSIGLTLLLACFGWAALQPQFVHAAPADIDALDPALTAARAKLLDPDADDLERLEALLQFAPSREPGQPGNERLEHLFAQRFQLAAERINRQNKPGQWDTAQALHAKADAADALIIEAADAMQIEGAATTLASPWYVRYTLEDPTILTVTMVIVVVMLLSAWYYQRRPALAGAGAAVVLMIIALTIGAALTVTSIEQINRAGRLHQNIIDTTNAIEGLASRIVEDTKRLKLTRLQLAESPTDTRAAAEVEEAIARIEDELAAATKAHDENPSDAGATAIDTLTARLVSARERLEIAKLETSRDRIRNELDAARRAFDADPTDRNAYAADSIGKRLKDAEVRSKARRREAADRVKTLKLRAAKLEDSLARTERRLERDRANVVKWEAEAENWLAEIEAELESLAPEFDRLALESERLTEQFEPHEARLSDLKLQRANLRHELGLPAASDDGPLTPITGEIGAATLDADPHRLELTAHERATRPLRDTVRDLREMQSALTGKGAKTRDAQERRLALARREAFKADLHAAQAATGLWLSGQMHVPSAVFKPGVTRLASADGTAVRLYQIAPNFVDPANLPEGGFAGRLVYVGRATPDDLAGRNLEGAAVLVDSDCDRRWLTPIQLGADVVIVLEPNDGPMESIQAAMKRSPTPVSIPRFYLRYADLVALYGHDWSDALAAGQSIEIKQQPGKWAARDAKTSWLFIPGTTDATLDGTIGNDPFRQLVHVQTYLDSASIVPDLSPGANSATNMVLILKLLEHFEAQPPKRPVLISVVNNHTDGLSGEESFAHYAFTLPESLREELETIDRDLAIERYTHELYSQKPDKKYIQRIRSLEEKVGRKQFRAKEPIAEGYLAHMRNLSREERNDIEMSLRRHRDAIADHKEAIAKNEKAITGHREKIAEHRKAIDDGKDSDLTDQDVAELQVEIAELDAKTAAAKAAIADIEPEIAALEPVRDQIKSDADELVVLLELFKPIGKPQDFDELHSGLRDLLDGAFENIADESGDQTRAFDGVRRQQRENLKLRRRLLVLRPEWIEQLTSGELDDLDDDEVFDRRYAPLPALAALSLDLTVGTDEVGFFHRGLMTAATKETAETALDRQRVQRLARSSWAVAEEWSSTERPSRLVATIHGTDKPWPAYFGGSFPVAATLMHQHIQPGLTLTGVRDQRTRAFTPHDDLANLNTENYRTLVDFLTSYLPEFINLDGLGTTVMTRGTAGPYSLEVTVRKLDKYSVTIPKIRVPGALVAAPVGAPPPGANNPFMLGQVRPWRMLIADQTGRARVRGKTAAAASMQIFDYSDDFRTVKAALDLGAEGESRFPSVVGATKNTYFKTASMVVFPCRKVDLIGLTDPLTLKVADQITILDGQQDSTPRFYGISGMLATSSAKVVHKSLDGTASIFIDPAAPFKLRIGPIASTQSLAINATEEDSKGEGFPSDIGMIRDLTLTSAEDMARLTDGRLKTLVEKGVVNETAQQFHETATTAITEANDPAIASRNDQRLNLGERARGLEYQAYTRGLGTINDLIRAVIIFPALVIPFCFFLMKLVSPFTDVNRQLAMFVVIFAIMAVTLQFVHPAFEIAQTPHVVILAFVILGLAVFVAMVVIGRFNASMNQVVEESQMSESADAPQSRLAGAAFMVGVNNMKRRRIRTTLTCATIVLVTFTMLSVISVGQNVAPITLRRTSEAPYNGFVFTMPGLVPIDVNRLERLRAHFADQDTVARAWSQRQGVYGEYLPYELIPIDPVPGAGSDKLLADVLVGLETAEDGFVRPLSGPDGILAAGRWFSRNDAAEVVLSVEAAAVIGLDETNFTGRQFRLHGRVVEVVGLIDDDQLKKLEDLGEVKILPLLVEPKQEGATVTTVTTTVSDTAMEGRGLSDIVGASPAEPRKIAFVPIDFAMNLGEATYRTLSIKYADSASAGDAVEQAKQLAAEAWKDTSDLIEFQNIRLIVSLQQPVVYGEQESRVEAGQYAVASSSSAQVGGVVKVAIPVILAATIILNTMLGSVMERRREIGIYNAIGLNPSHVMVFFLAESLVFGMVGAVAGYLIGQILSVVIAALFPGFLNLNYSSLSVMVVIFLAIGTVLASTIYPAVMAARAAVPSGQRRWSLPQPEGDEITVKFPFSYDAERVLGICAYLRDYMHQNSEASTGNFLARLGPVGTVPIAAAAGDAGKDESAYVMLFDIAPAPFDLGVNQSMEVYAYHDPRVRAHMLSVHLRRISGERSNWVTVNQPFLESLRKRLLSWRSQKAETQRSFFEVGEQLFKDAPQLAVLADDTETRP